MKHGKRPTRRQKKLMSDKKLNYSDWLVVKDCEETFVVVHKKSGTIRRFPKLKGVVI
ncbi:hypothetical protein SH1V18_15250 [Vallitalea longa]|uniref:DUF6906 domain-containing protein n=1 Tax=Vallitalea longa TaxID=2936439 RepID=A0A9W5YAH2_9FIRM|nr:hypothetical protein SH1V18_15250 [Vallitalea longa]